MRFQSRIHAIQKPIAPLHSLELARDILDRDAYEGPGGVWAGGSGGGWGGRACHAADVE